MKPPTDPVTHIRLTRRGEWIPAKPIDGGVHSTTNETTGTGGTESSKPK